MEKVWASRFLQLFDPLASRLQIVVDAIFDCDLKMWYKFNS